MQWFSDLLDPLVTDDPSRLLQTVMFAIGIVLFCGGASLYMSASLGNSPYDSVAPIIVDHSGWPYRFVRTVQDLAFVALAVIFHGQIGPGTVMTAFFTGPLISFFNEKINGPLMRKDQARLDARYERRHPVSTDTVTSGSPEVENGESMDSAEQPHDRLRRGNRPSRQEPDLRGVLEAQEQR